MHPSTKELMERRLDLMNPLKKRDAMCDRNGEDPCKTGCRIELPSHGHWRVYTLLKIVGGSPAMGELITAGGTTVSVPLIDNPLELSAAGLCTLVNRCSGLPDSFPAVLLIDGNTPVPLHSLLAEYVLAHDDSIRPQFRHLFVDDYDSTV